MQTQFHFVLLLLNLDLIGFVVLTLLLSRNLIKAYFERRHRLVGSGFRTKLIAAFIGFSLIPTVLLALVAAIVFFLGRLTGNPVDLMLPEDATAEDRAAMIKARAAAGDVALGEDFLDRLKPYIWRKYLDFAAIADVLVRTCTLAINHPEILELDINPLLADESLDRWAGLHPQSQAG